MLTADGQCVTVIVNDSNGSQIVCLNCGNGAGRVASLDAIPAVKECQRE